MSSEKKYFRCTKLRAIISTDYCAENQRTNKEICYGCVKPDYLDKDCQYIDIDAHMRENPAVEPLPKEFRTPPPKFYFD